VAGTIICTAVGLTGALWLWHSNNAPRQVAIISARIVPEHEEVGSIEWKFDRPNSIFDYSRRGESVWIDGIEIRAVNRTGQPLQNPKADIRPDRMGKDILLNLALGDVRIDLSKGFVILPGNEFTLVSTSEIKEGSNGILADQFLPKFGGLTFTFRHDGGETFTRYFSPDEIEQQISRIKQQSRKSL
jgi:hypothetical protein